MRLEFHAAQHLFVHVQTFYRINIYKTAEEGR